LQRKNVWQDFIFSIDRLAAGGHGHLSGYFQDEKDNWYKIDKYIGQNENPSTTGLLLNKGYSEFITILPISNADILNIKQDTKNNIYIETTKIQDEAIAKKAFELKNKKSGMYRLFTDNCADSLQEIAEDGGIETPLDIDPRPNTIFDNIKKMYQNEHRKN